MIEDSESRVDGTKLTGLDTQSDRIVAALAEAAQTLAEAEAGYAQAVKRICSILHEYAWDPTVARVLFHLAVKEGTPLRARFVAHTLMKHNQGWLAAYLVPHGLSSGAKKYERDKFGALLEQNDSTNRYSKRPSCLLSFTVDRGNLSVDKLGEEDSVEFPLGDTARIIFELKNADADLHAGVHLDTVKILIRGQDPDSQRIVDLLERLQIYPATFPVVFEYAASAAEFLAQISDSFRSRISFLVAVTARNGVGYHLVSAGGRSLYEVGSPGDYVLSNDQELWSMSAAVGLLSLVRRSVLASYRSRIISSFHRERGGDISLSSSRGWVEIATRYYGTGTETAAWKRYLISHMLHTGFYGEAYALLLSIPFEFRDDDYSSRVVRALFGLGRFAEVAAIKSASRLPVADQKLVSESRGALSMLSRLSELLSKGPQESLDSYQNKVVSILHASVPDQSGGYAVRAHSILNELRANGFAVAPYTRPGFPENTNTLGPGEISYTIEDHLTYGRIGSKSTRQSGEYRYMAESVDHYIEVIRRERPAVVHLRSTYVSALPGIIAAKHFGLPVVYEVSGMWELVYESHDNAKMEGRRARTVRLEDAVLAAADSVCTITAAMADIVRARVDLRAPISIIPNAVDITNFVESEKDDHLLDELSWKRKTPTVGYIGSFVDYEGLDILVRALSRLQDLGVEFYALFVGDGAEFQAIQNLAASLGLDTATVRFTGRVPHSEVNSLYSLIDICVYPRRYTAATAAVSPLKPFEAMALGKTVIVSDVPALREIAGDGERALIVEEGNATALAELLKTVISELQETGVLRQRAREWVQEERSWKKVGNRFSELIAQTIRPHNGVAGAGMESE